MKVLEHSSSRLSIQEQLLGIRLLSLSTACTGLFMFFLFEPPVDWIGAFCIALGTTFPTFAPKENLTFDRNSGWLTICRHKFTARQVSYYKITDVEMVNVETLTILRTRFYRIHLYTTSGSRFAISKTMTTDWAQQEAIARHIRTFLKAPFPSSSKDTLQPS